MTGIMAGALRRCTNVPWPHNNNRSRSIPISSSVSLKAQSIYDSSCSSKMPPIQINQTNGEINQNGRNELCMLKPRLRLLLLLPGNDT